MLFGVRTVADVIPAPAGTERLTARQGLSEPPVVPWICSLSLWLAWKVTTRRASIGIASPVRGLRPGRGALVRIWKLPKPEILTSAPSTRLPASELKQQFQAGPPRGFASRLVLE